MCITKTDKTMENKGITTEEIIKIKPGTSISMILPANKCYSVKQMAYQAQFKYPRPDVERYSVRIDMKESRITITAVPKKKGE